MLFNLSTAQAQSPENGEAAEGQTEIKPLQIGDTIPEELWNMRLEVVNHPERKDTITLNDYRDSILLLDFLSTGCKSCIGALPRLSAVQSETDHPVKILPITTDKIERVTSFWHQNDSTMKADMEVCIIKKDITGYFPHRYISHIVWIDMHGVVRAFTNSNHIQPRTIQAFADGHHTDWPVKTESTSFFQETLLHQNPETMRLKNNRQRSYSYALITGFTEGVSPYVEIMADSSRKGKIISYRNRSILDLYLIAADLLYKMRPEQIILQVENPDNYDIRRADFTGMTKDEWYQKNAICYEQYVSADMSDVEYRTQMLQHLNNLLGIQGTVENRDGKPFLIIAEKGNN